MALETAAFVSSLVATNPTSTDNVNNGDNHLRLIKSVLISTFPNLAGALQATHSEIDSAVTLANAATDANTNNSIVKRDAAGNFTASTVTANLTGNASGNAATASRWLAAKTLTLAGSLTGSASIRGDAHVTLDATVNDNSHAHTIANVSGLQNSLNLKVNASEVLTSVPANALFTDTNTEYSVGDGALTEKNFTTAFKNKLSGIEASADVTDTNNVVAALSAGSNVSISSQGVISSTDTNTTYSVGDGGLTQHNFDGSAKSKLDSVEANATADQTASEILEKLKTVDANNSGLNCSTWKGYYMSTSNLGSESDHIYFRT